MTAMLVRSQPRRCGHFRGKRHELSAQTIPALGGGRRRAPDCLVHREGASLSGSHDHAHRAVSARREHRRRRPHRRRPHVAHPRPAGHRAERLGGRRHDRLEPGDARRSGWLHHPDGSDGHPRCLRRALSEPRIQARHRFRADRHGHSISIGHRSKEGLPAKGPQGIRRLSEGERQHAQPGACRCRLDLFTTCLLLNSIVGTNPTLVPFNGGAPAMNALVAGQVDYMCADIITGGTHLEAGRIKIYAIAAAERNPALASVPTTVEGGLPEFQVSAWNGLFAPKATPKPIIDTLADALDKALDDDATRKRLLVLGCDIPDKPKRGPQPFLALVKSEIARWTPIIQAANVKLD